MNRRQIETIAKKVANIRRAMGRNFSHTIEKRFDKLNEIIESLPLGQQLAISFIATRINEERE